MFYKGNEDREKRLRFSIRKVSFGAASVAVAALYLFMGSGAVSAEEAQAIQSNEEVAADKDSEIEKKSEEQQPTYAAPAAKEQGSATNTEAGDEGKQESHPETKEEEANSSERSETTTKTQSDENSVSGDSSSPKSTEDSEGTRSEEASNKPKVRKRRDAPAPTATPTDDDLAANQTYTAPGDDAGLDELKEKLEKLPSAIQNNTKINDMDKLGEQTNTQSGQVKNITNFGGWKAVGETGKFAIAKKTEDGVFPIETVNTVYSEQNGKHYRTYTGEQAFDRTSNYILLLSEVRTRASSKEAAYDNSEYRGTGLSGSTAKALKDYNGIEKTFKAYSTEVGSKVKIQFKTGYTGDINGTKAKYKVEVIVNKNGKPETVYSKMFDPQKDLTDSDATVTKARDGNGQFIRSRFNNYNLNKTEVESKMKGAYIPTGTAGTFESKEIDLEKGVTDYTVRISSADNEHLGMGYQSPLRQYALPISGLGFNITQDTNKIAKDLLSRIYEKLKATAAEDERGMTSDSKDAYNAELEKVKNLIENINLDTTDNYKKALKNVLQKQKELTADKTELTEVKTALEALTGEADPTTGKTTDSAKAYNDAKTAAQEAIQEAETVINDENATPEKVREALNKVNEKKAALEAAKQALVEAATPEEKAKLKTAADSLVKADETGKTPESIAAYERKYEELKAQLEEAKAAAAAVEAKGDNATKAEVQEAQAQVEAAKAELTKAAELLVNKADKSELTNAKEALNTLATEADPTTGKTTDSAKAYNDAKTAAQEAIQEAEIVINDENATPEKVREALNKVNEKKAALEAAKQALVEAATPEEKAKLKTAADSLVKADETGKTPESIAAYERKYEELKAQLEEAKAAAA
uniref:YSIRK-type signal peptide-containing protein n=1 Tax=Streptococcus sp. 79 TaxID=2582638 RepID=UPI0015623F19